MKAEIISQLLTKNKLFNTFEDISDSLVYYGARSMKDTNEQSTQTTFKNNGLFKWQAGAQYISFRSDWWSDSFQGSSGNSLMNVDIKNYEQGIVVNGGFRFTATNGLSKNGNFRPYVGGLLGLAIFSEKTSYDWGDDCSTFGFFMDIK